MKELSEQAKREIARIFGSAPFISRLGARLVVVEPGFCESQLELRDDHLQQDGFVHAGVQATLADHTAGAAAASLIADDEIVLTAEFKISLYRAARGTSLTCNARVVKAGTQLTFVESEVLCTRGTETTPVSKATVSIAVVKRDR